MLKTGQWNVVVVHRYETRNGRRIKGRTNIVATLVVAVLIVLVTKRLDYQDNVDRLGHARKKTSPTMVVIVEQSKQNKKAIRLR